MVILLLNSSNTVSRTWDRKERDKLNVLSLVYPCVVVRNEDGCWLTDYEVSKSLIIINSFWKVWGTIRDIVTCILFFDLRFKEQEYPENKVTSLLFWYSWCHIIPIIINPFHDKNYFFIELSTIPFSESSIKEFLPQMWFFVQKQEYG